ncbi:MAG TPA: hypothetical protein VL381_07305 [Rhodocyclaceae bacterium]|nr:hypothetical protein [Rhodocyclaceae bacterium]
MRKQDLLSPKVAAHHSQVVVREVMLLLAIAFVGVLLQAGGHAIPVLALDGILISTGLIGLLTAIFLCSVGNRRWFIVLSAAAISAGVAQLFWSSGMAVGFLVLIAVLPIANALANILILGRHIWLDYRHGK